VWALSELMDEDRFAALRLHGAAQENDASVLTEWHKAAKNQ
jgi:epoxyqueuosine reductase